jgi:hypothetical protein
MIVTLCGSARFEDHFKTWNEALTMAGHTVFTLTRYASEKGKKNWYSDAEKKALDEAHKRKINASEAVLVLNVFGYMGPSTLGEVEHAKKRGKDLYVLESWGKGNGICGMHHDYVQEACRRVIPEGYVGSPIDTTSNSGFRYAYDLLDDVVTGERSYDLVKMVQAADERIRTGGVAPAAVALPSVVFPASVVGAEAAGAYYRVEDVRRAYGVPGTPNDQGENHG